MTSQTALIAPPEPTAPTVLLPADVELDSLWKLEVLGEAVPQGSFVPFIGKYNGKAMLKSSNEKALNAWRKTVADTARLRRPPWLREPWDGPIFISIVFVRERGDDYLVDGTTLKKGARRYPDTAPDGDKLDRAIWDALTDVAFTNDARVVFWAGAKRYAEVGEAARTLIDVGFLR